MLLKLLGHQGSKSKLGSINYMKSSMTEEAEVQMKSSFCLFWLFYEKAAPLEAIFFSWFWFHGPWITSMRCFELSITRVATEVAEEFPGPTNSETLHGIEDWPKSPLFQLCQQPSHDLYAQN